MEAEAFSYQKVGYSSQQEAARASHEISSSIPFLVRGGSSESFLQFKKTQQDEEVHGNDIHREKDARFRPIAKGLDLVALDQQVGGSQDEN